MGHRPVLSVVTITCTWRLKNNLLRPYARNLQGLALGRFVSYLIMDSLLTDALALSMLTDALARVYSLNSRKRHARRRF